MLHFYYTKDSTVAYYENDERQPKKSLIIKLFKIFDVTTDYLLSDNEAFIADAEDQYGYRGKKKAESFIEEAALLFAGGELNEEDQYKVFKAMTEIYFLSKEKNKTRNPFEIAENMNIDVMFMDLGKLKGFYKRDGHNVRRHIIAKLNVKIFLMHLYK